MDKLIKRLRKIRTKAYRIADETSDIIDGLEEDIKINTTTKTK